MGMAVRKLLKNSDGSYRVTLPKDELQAAGVIPDDGELQDETFVKVDGEGRRFQVEVLEL